MKNGSGSLANVLISLHDVMPETFPRVEEILAMLTDLQLGPITLLVVPGRQWEAHQLDQLRDWAGSGYEIAAHGWSHQAHQIKGLYHCLHSTFISKDVAEHLCLSPSGIKELMERSFAWFPENGLGRPELYVPPAWALGSISRESLAALPFSQIEVLRGLLFPATGKLLPLPMIGFEVHSRWESAFVRQWNRWNFRKALKTGQPLRIGIHPHDFQLQMASDLRNILEHSPSSLTYAKITSP